MHDSINPLIDDSFGVYTRNPTKTIRQEVETLKLKSL